MAVCFLADAVELHVEGVDTGLGAAPGESGIGHRQAVGGDLDARKVHIPRGRDDPQEIAMEGRLSSGELDGRAGCGAQVSQDL